MYLQAYGFGIKVDTFGCEFSEEKATVASSGPIRFRTWILFLVIERSIRPSGVTVKLRNSTAASSAPCSFLTCSVFPEQFQEAFLESEPM